MNNKKAEPQIKDFELSDLNPAPYNPRTITDDALDGLANSLRKFGCVEPIVVNVRDSKNTIIGGHQRHKALLKLHGSDYTSRCIVVDLNEADEKLLNLSLNNPEIQGEFIEKLAKYIDELKEQIPDASEFVNLRISELQFQLTGVDVNEVDFSPNDDGTRLDELNPMLVTCPKCGNEFDVRKTS